MKKIELSCFKDSKVCNLNPKGEKINIYNSNESEYLFSVFNHSRESCHLYLTILYQDPNSEVKLRIFSEENLIVDEVIKNLSSKISLGLLDHSSNKNYYFDFYKIEGVDFTFDLNFDFQCSSGENFELEKKEEKQAVLGQKADLLEEEKLETHIPSSRTTTIYFYLILLAVLIFVIIIFINGKKKKKKF